ncbi:MAG: hypothetical protein V1811_01920 [Candidatus Micrarchaeota archaeon]
MITGARVSSVSGKKMKDGNVDAFRTNIDVTDVSFDKGKITVAYTYTTDYDPGLAQIEVKGEFYLDEANRKEIEESWKKNKQLPNSIAEELVTHLTYSATAVGTLIAFALNVAAPISVPRARLQQPEQKKAG